MPIILFISILKINDIQIRIKIQMFLYVGLVVSSNTDKMITEIGKIYTKTNSKYFRILNFW